MLSDFFLFPCLPLTLSLCRLIDRLPCLLVPTEALSAVSSHIKSILRWATNRSLLIPLSRIVVANGIITAASLEANPVTVACLAIDYPTAVTFTLVMSKERFLSELERAGSRTRVLCSRIGLLAHFAPPLADEPISVMPGIVRLI